MKTFSTILILGAGFAGIKTARALAKKGIPKGFRVIIIDAHNVHIYTPDLYEIATAFHEKITEQCLTQLKDTVATPILKTLPATKNVEFLRDTVAHIDPAKKIVTLKRGGALHFDYLAICLGSVVNYYNIPGLQQFSYPLKTLTDALAINCLFDHYFHTLWKQELKKRVSIVIGGGGATGIECACELPGYIKKLCDKYSYPYELVDITLVEGLPHLAGSDSKATSAIIKRCHTLGVRVLTHTLIKEVAANSIAVEVRSERKKTDCLPMDILVWTGGVRPSPLIAANFGKVAHDGGLMVNKFLQSVEYPYIFAAGDNAHIENPVPMLAQAAVQEGKILAENILATIAGKKKTAFKPHLKGIIIPLGGKYALFKKDNFILRGYSMWALRRLIDLNYALTILPFFYAIRKWWHDTNIFTAND